MNEQNYTHKGCTTHNRAPKTSFVFPENKEF